MFEKLAEAHQTLGLEDVTLSYIAGPGKHSKFFSALVDVLKEE